MADGDINFSISSDELDEKGKMINQQFRIIEEALQEIEEAKGKLASWESRNKDKYENKINTALPKMHEMANAIKSYGDVASLTSRRLNHAESVLSSQIDG